MDLVLLFQILGISLAVILYCLGVFKLFMWVADKINEYAGFIVVSMGILGIPVAVGASILSVTPMP